MILSDFHSLREDEREGLTHSTALYCHSIFKLLFIFFNIYFINFFIKFCCNISGVVNFYYIINNLVLIHHLKYISIIISLFLTIMVLTIRYR
jgi:hypothetical protein